jgi:hypothetical protein
MFNPPNLANMDADQIKKSGEMFKNMSDDDIQRNLNQAKSFMPGNNLFTNHIYNRNAKHLS